MTAHLSLRLAWHDRGWDGHICDAPRLNASCIVHEHIRDSRQDDLEQEHAGAAIADLEDWLPPCSRDPAAYAEKGFRTVHRDPLEFRKLPAVEEELPPYSCCPSPYRWMREDFFQEIAEAENLEIRGPDDEDRKSGWVYEPDRQLALLKEFWSRLEQGGSLVFYYVNQGNPLDEAAARIVVGVGRLAEIGEQLYFGTKPPKFKDRYPIWSRRITQDYPGQGVRIPYQEYLRAGHSTDGIVCKVPPSTIMPAFSYVAEHVSDDIAVSVLERVIQCIERVKDDKVVAGDWDGRLKWLNDVLGEAWSGRGPFPGLGSVLEYLGCARGTTFHRKVLAPMARKGKDPWEYVLAILEGRKEPKKDEFAKGLRKASAEWKKRKSRHALLARLVRFELTTEQVERTANPDLRTPSGMDFSEKELAENPYIISECDLGSGDSPPVSLETIDHGMRPEGDARLFSSGDDVPHDDRRVLRAVAHSVLREAADQGDTVLSLSALMDRMGKRFPERRACRPDRESFIADADFYSAVLWTSFEGEKQLAAVSSLHELERHAADIVQRRAKKKNRAPAKPIDWHAGLVRVFEKAKTEREKAAFTEKEKALAGRGKSQRTGLA